MHNKFIISALILFSAAIILYSGFILLGKPTQIVASPPAGKIYHGVYPGGVDRPESSIVRAELDSYQQTVGKKAAWVYVPNNWFTSRRFPLAAASWVRQNGSVPFIRLMLLSSARNNVAEPTFTLDRINHGDFDKDLRAWARSAREFKTPLLAEYGTEVNGQWFPWNGIWNGKAAGPKKFKLAYCHIIQIMREEKTDNLLWVFHVNDRDNPAVAWNRLENYYPGDKWIDWVGVSVFAAQNPVEVRSNPFRKLMDKVYPRLVKLSHGKPIALLEFGVTAGSPSVNQAAWADQALRDLTAFRWPRLVGFSWWNEAWQNNNNNLGKSNMRVQDNPDLAKVFKQRIGMNHKVLGKIVVKNR